MSNGSFHGTDCFEVLSFLQRNDSSKLFKVCSKTDGEYFTMEVATRSNNVGPTNAQLQRAPSEHFSKFLINLRYAFQTQSKFYYILDFIGDKTLEDVLQEQGCLKEDDVSFYASDIVLALQELHQFGLSYGELSLAKVMVKQSGRVVLWRSFCGKKYWSHSECICSFPGMTRGAMCGNSHKLSTREEIAQDWRSFAALIYRMLTGQGLTTRFNNDKEIEIKYVMRSLTLPSTFSASVQDLIRRLWCGLINSDNQVQEHPFFKNANWKQVPTRINPFPAVPYNNKSNSLTPSSRFTSSISDDYVKYSNLFGQRLHGSSSTPDISETVLDQRSPKPFYTTLPQTGDSSYRHFDFSARHQNVSNAEQQNNRSYSSKQWGEFQTSSPKFSDYQRTTVSSNTNSSNMLLQRCSSLTELDRETGFRQKIQYSKWEDYPPNCKSSDKTYQTTIHMKRAADRKSSLSSSVPNLVDAIQKETFQHLNSGFENESGAANILSGDTRPIAHEFKSSKNWQNRTTANNQKHDLSSFSLYEAHKFAEFANQETTSHIYSSNESVEKRGSFRDDIEVQRSRSSSVFSQSCADIDQLDMINDRLVAESSNGGKISSASSNESRRKHPLAKVPIPSFEEFKFLRSQSLPGGNTLSDSGTSESIRPYQNIKTETSKKVSDEYSPTTTSSVTNVAKRNPQHSRIYQTMGDVAGKNTNSLDHSNSSLSAIESTTTSTTGRERPQLKKNFKSSPVLARFPLNNTCDLENRTTPLNDSHSSENEFSYFSRNEVIHNLMLKYGLYSGYSNKNESSSAPEKNYPSENIQEEETRVTNHNSSESCTLDSKLRDNKELERNGISRVAQNVFVGEEKIGGPSSVKTKLKRQVKVESISEIDKTTNHTTAMPTEIKTFNEMVVDTKRNSFNQNKEDLKYFSIRENSVKDLYSNSKRISNDGNISNNNNKIMDNDKKASENIDYITLCQKVAEDEPGRFQNGLDKLGKHNLSEKPKFYNISRSTLLASKLGMSKKAKQSNKDDPSEQNSQSPTRTKTRSKGEVKQALERSPNIRFSRSELPADDHNSVLHESNHPLLRRKSFHSSTLSISSIYSACSSEPEENINVLGEGDTLMQDSIRKRGGRKSRWDSFHSDISADSGSCHMFEYETDFSVTEVEDDDAERNNAEGDERKFEADVKRADSGYGGELSIPETPKVKRRLEEIVEGSSKHWSVVAATAKHWREVAKQRRIQRKGSPLRSPRRSSVTDDMILCPDCLKHFIPEDKENSLKFSNKNGSKSSLICGKCKARHVERKEAIIELVQTETNYGTDLHILKEEFYLPMQSGSILSPEHLAAIFLNLQELLEVNGKFSARLQKGLEESVAKGDEEFAELNVGKAFLNSVEFFQAYEIYCSKQNAAAVLLESLQKKNELLKIFLNVTCRENPKCRKMDLNSFLLAPVQRIMKYPLLLSRIRKATPRWNTDREKLQLAQRKIEEQLSRINAMNTAVESKQRKYRGSGHLGRSDSMDKLQLKKMAGEILNWSIAEMQLLMHGIFQVSVYEFISNSGWNRRPYKKALDVYVLFCIRGHNEPIKVDSDDEGEFVDISLFPGEGDITDACLLLLKKKLNGKYTLFKDPLSLDTCVVCRDSDHKDTFEIINMNRETYLFKSDTNRDCRRWLKFLRLSAKDLGNWKRRRNGLPNIMIKNL